MDGTEWRERTGRQLTAADAALLVGAGVLAGVTSTVAGLASLVSYPALLVVGLSAVEANVTNTSALLFVALGAALGSRAELDGQGRRVAVLGGVALAGGTAGAVLLLTTPDGTFERVVPWLIAAAAVLLLVRRRVGVSTREQVTPSRTAISDQVVVGPAAPLRPWAVAGMFAVAVYVGYFGAGGGVALLALLALALPEPLARLNAVKNVASGFANVSATVVFATSGPVDWAAVVPLACGLFVGGATGPAIVRRLPEPVMRWTVALAAFGLAAVLAVKSYR